MRGERADQAQLEGGLRQRTVGEYRQAGHQGQSPKCSQEPRQAPLAASLPSNLLGRARLWQACLPHPLCLVSGAVLAGGDRTATGPGADVPSAGNRGCRRMAAPTRRSRASGQAPASALFSKCFHSHKAPGKEDPPTHPTSLSADEEPDVQGGTAMCLRARAGNHI